MEAPGRTDVTVRHAARRDEAEPGIISALVGIGAKVQPLSDTNVPDLLVGWCGINVLLEVKTGDARLRPGQKEWIRQWAGPVFVVRSEQEAVEAVTVLAPALLARWRPPEARAA